MNIRYLVPQLRRARYLKPSVRYLCRELLLRRRVESSYLLRGQGQTINLRHRTQDVGGITEVLVNGNYDFPAEVHACLGQGRIMAVDLGANIGLFGVKLFSQYPDAELVAFEPDPGNADVLERTVQANGRRESWRVIRACAATTDGVVRFRSGDFLFSRISDEGVITTALDVFPYLADADLMKIDIEGAEEALIRDPRFRTLTARALFLEYHPPITLDEVLDTLRQMQFTCGPVRTKSTPGFGELWAWREVVEAPVAFS